MKVGDTVETAMWLTGDEPREMVERFKLEVTGAIDELCETEGYFHGEVIFMEKHPDDERVPEVPEHIQGQKVRLLVGESPLVVKLPEETEKSFVANLDRKDLTKLRLLTRKAAAKHFKRVLSDIQADEIIESLGIDSALATLRINDD